MTLAIIIGASLGLVGLLSLIAFCRSRACYFEPGFEPWPSDDRERFEGSSFDPIAAEAGERRGEYFIDLDDDYDDYDDYDDDYNDDNGG